MRQGQQNRRGRNRGGGGMGGGHSNNNNNNNGGGRKHQNALSRSYESSGPDIKIRGTAMHIAEKYTTLARDAMASGDSVAAENYLQHAEHYNRIILAAQAQAVPNGVDGAVAQPQSNGGGQRYQPEGYPQGDGPDGDGDDDEIISHRPSFLERPVNLHQQPQPYIQQPAFPPNQPQPAPRPNGNGAVPQPQQDAEAAVSPDGERLPQRRRRRRPLLGEAPQRPFNGRNGAGYGGAAGGDAEPGKDPSSSDDAA